MKRNNTTIFGLILLSIACLLLSACRHMSPDEYEEWKGLLFMQNDQYQKMTEKEIERIAKAREEIARRQQERQFLEQKAASLEEENRRLQENRGEQLGDACGAFTYAYSQFLEQQDIFQDIVLAGPIQRFPKTFQAVGPTVIIDMGRVVPAECLIQNVQIYSHKKLQPQVPEMFYAATFYKTYNGLYAIRSISECLTRKQMGSNTYAPLRKPIVAMPGDRYGLILLPGATIDYGEVDMDLMQKVGVDDFDPKNVKEFFFHAAPPAKRANGTAAGSRTYSFEFTGASVRKYLFVLDYREKIQTERTFSNLTVRCKNTERKDAFQCNFYMAVFRPYGNNGKYELVALSERMSLQGLASQQFEVCGKQGDKITAYPGDMVAYIISPGNHGSLCFPDQFREIEKNFDPFQKGRFILPGYGEWSKSPVPQPGSTTLYFETR